MAKITLQTDSEYTRQLMEAGGKNLKECYQCATCSVACPLAPDAAPYPRKEMIWASWGLKDKLMSDVDLWLCHNCGNCSDLCPRGARPAAMMSAARDMVYRDLMAPSIIGKWMSSPRGLPWLFLIPAVIWFVVWWIRAAIMGSWFPRTEDGKIVFGQIFSGDYTIDPIFMLTFFTALAILVRGSMKLWDRFKPKGKTTYIGPHRNWLLCIWDVLWEEVISANRFSECADGPKTGQPEQSRRLSHTMIVWSFCILAFVTAVVALGHWGGKIIPAILIETPMPQTFWVKIIANVGAVLLLVALALLTWRRLSLNRKYQTSSYYDWYLLGIIWLVALTGMGWPIFWLMDCIHTAFIVYYLHLVFVWMLFAWVPWTKLGHFVYRAVAMVYVRMYGRG